MSTKVVTGKVRLSYAQLFEPKAVNDGDTPKYSVTLLIPKNDTRTVQMIRAAIQEAADTFRKRNGTQSLPAQPTDPIHDGDGLKPSGDPYGPECKGCWVIATSSAQKPVVVDAFRNEVTDPAEVYSGCYGRASINFYGYNNRKKGIGCGLLAIQKLSDGEPFGTVGSANDFDDGFTDPDAAGMDDFMR